MLAQEYMYTTKFMCWMLNPDLKNGLHRPVRKGKKIFNLPQTTKRDGLVSDQ